LVDTRQTAGDIEVREVQRIGALVEAQLASIEDKARRGALRAVLIDPVLEQREWEYGAADEQYPCWLIAKAERSRIGLAYCEYGFGPGDPWGIVFLDQPSLGMDAAWYTRLEDAFVNSPLWAGPLPPDYEVP
jgi:hypothetical protein